MFNFKDGINVGVTHFFITQIRTNIIFFLIKMENICLNVKKTECTLEKATQLLIIYPLCYKLEG